MVVLDVGDGEHLRGSPDDAELRLRKVHRFPVKLEGFFGRFLLRRRIFAGEDDDGVVPKLVLEAMLEVKRSDFFRC